MNLWLAFALGCASAPPPAPPAVPPPSDPAPAAAAAAPSLYELAVPLVGADGAATSLDVHRGHLALVSMFYASCDSACPLLVQQLRALEDQLDEAHRAELRVLLVSLDPDRDSPATLAETANRYGVDPKRWVLASPPADRVRELAAVLGIQYRPGAAGEIHHTTVVVLVDGEGRELARFDGKTGSMDALRGTIAAR